MILSQKFAKIAAIDSTMAIPPILVGSNYLQWMVDCVGGWGVIKQFHLQRSLICQQLDQMCAAGQTALRLPVCHTADPPPADTDTFNLSSEGGTLDSQCSENLTGLLTEIKKRPFQLVIVGLFPQWNNAPAAWIQQGWNESAYQNNWNFAIWLVNTVRKIMAGGSQQMWFDYLNEGLHSGNLPILVEYCQRLWWGVCNARLSDGSLALGAQDALGFSIDGQLNTDVWREVYTLGGAVPTAIDVHIYHDTPPLNSTTGDPFAAYCSVDDGLKDLGWTGKLFVGECNIDSARNYAGIYEAARQRNRWPTAVIEWPWHDVPLCPNSGPTDCVPLDSRVLGNMFT
jgi:hypothetical protein